MGSAAASGESRLVSLLPKSDVCRGTAHPGWVGDRLSYAGARHLRRRRGDPVSPARAGARGAVARPHISGRVARVQITRSALADSRVLGALHNDVSSSVLDI